MKISIAQLSKLLAGTLAGFGAALIFSPSASFAQTSQNVNVPSTYQNDGFSNKQGDGTSLQGVQNGNFNPMDLIHRANFGTLNWQEFSAENGKQINSEAGSFRERQRKLLQQRGQYQQPKTQYDFVLPVYTPAQTTPASK